MGFLSAACSVRQKATKSDVLYRGAQWIKINQTFFPSSKIRKNILIILIINAQVNRDQNQNAGEMTVKWDFKN